MMPANTTPKGASKFPSPGLLFGIALILTACGPLPSPPEGSGSTESGKCPARHIFVFDRSSDLDVEERKWLDDGIERLFASRLFAGEYVAYEIRDNRFGVVDLVELITIEQQPSKVPTEECVVGPYAREALAACNKRNSDKLDAFNGATKARQDSWSKAVEQTKAAIRDNRKTETNTEVADAIAQVLKKDCLGRVCAVQVFSDLIDVEPRRKMREGGWTVQDAESLGEARARTLLNTHFENLGKPSFSVRVWGVGTEEQPNTQLSRANFDLLQGYWRKLFSELGADPYLIETVYSDLPNFPTSIEKCRAP